MRTCVNDRVLQPAIVKCQASRQGMPARRSAPAAAQCSTGGPTQQQHQQQQQQRNPSYPACPPSHTSPTTTASSRRWRLNSASTGTGVTKAGVAKQVLFDAAERKKQQQQQGEGSTRMVVSGGAGGGTSYDAFLALDQAWENLRNSPVSRPWSDGFPFLYVIL